MDTTTVAMGLSIIAFLTSAFVFFQLRDAKTPTEQTISITKPLQLQAYERLVLLCERIALPNLISRVSQPNLSVAEMQVFLVESIKQEFEYNATQQIYVSQTAWEAVRNLRDQNLLLINSISKSLSPNARASDLNRTIIEAIMQEERAALHTFTTDTVNAEAKKIM
ncbi:MAG: hypothetical protein V4676_12765 [Bacteroidota bacterium]